MEINLNFYTKIVTEYLVNLPMILIEICFFVISMDIYHELSEYPKRKY